MCINLSLQKNCFLTILVLFCFFIILPLNHVDADNGVQLPSEEVILEIEGQYIEEVQLEGIVTNDVLSIRSVLNTKAKSKFSQETIDDDIKSLYNLEVFDDIKVDVEEKDEGLVVTFIFFELPVIRDIIIKGNKKVAKRLIREEILLVPGSVIREQDILSDVQAIVDLYERKGFPNSTVEYEVNEVTAKRDKKKRKKKEKEEANAVELVFTIDESRRLIIDTINFSGVTIFDDKKLKRTMKTRERGDRFSGGFFKDDEFELDKREILRLYGDNGYIDAEIIKLDRKIQRNEKKNREEMTLTVYVDEGEQYTFGGVSISGNEVFNDSELYPLIDLKEESVFNQTEWEMGVQQIRNLLGESGYIYYQMGVNEKKDPEQLLISYDISVKENNKAHIENIYVTGNEKTKKFVIDREIEILEGEIFNSYKIQRSTEKLYNLQYFSTVNIDIKPGTELGLVDLIFDVEEQRTGLFSFGLSYSTSGYGISIFEEVSANNFLGRGLRLYEKVDVGFKRQEVEVGIDEPWLFNTPKQTSAGFSIGWSREEFGTRTGDDVFTFNEGTTDSDGDEIPDGVVENPDGTLDFSDANSMEYVHNSIYTAFRFGRIFGDYYGIKSELYFSVFRNFSETDDVPFDGDLRNLFEDDWPWKWKNYLSLTFYRDTRNLRYFATSGTLLSQNVTMFGGLIGGYSNFLRLITDTNLNVKTFWRFVLSVRLNFGIILPWFDTPLVIDDSDFLRVDGWNEGRGWQKDSQFGSLYSLRGRSEFNFSIEHRVPIVERLIWGLTFFDVSGLYSEPEDITFDPQDLWYSIGFGTAFLIPGFPIRLYLTRRFKYDQTDDEWELVNSQKFFRDWDFVFAVAGFF
jgi:outer membrane protein insertion porin family